MRTNSQKLTISLEKGRGLFEKNMAGKAGLPKEIRHTCNDYRIEEKRNLKNISIMNDKYRKCINFASLHIM
ncbi:MAG TPA: hypothetical protein DDZ04_02895 [Parabacteroides sp.]|nr:hypothetical protein [Parabacteroides sp.]